MIAGGRNPKGREGAQEEINREGNSGGQRQKEKGKQ